MLYSTNRNDELQAVSAQKNNRLISGNRVICRCTLELPKVDAFSNFQTDRQGYLSFNTRGGALYMGQQFTPLSINKVFNGDEASTLKNVVLYPPELPEVRLGQLNARFLHFTQGQKFIGLVIRFVGLSEMQLDCLNTLCDTLPSVEGSEEVALARAVKQTP